MRQQPNGAGEESEALQWLTGLLVMIGEEKGTKVLRRLVWDGARSWLAKEIVLKLTHVVQFVWRLRAPGLRERLE